MNDKYGSLDVVLKKKAVHRVHQRFALLSEFTANLIKPDALFLKSADF